MEKLLNLDCRVCGERTVEEFLDLGDQPHCNRLIPKDLESRREPFFPLRAGFCRHCSLVQIDHTIPKEDMFSDYPYVSGTTKTLVEHFRQTAARLVGAYGLKPGDLVVDIGSNDGTWLTQYRPFGLRAVGVEPAANVAALAQAAGVETEVRFFNAETADILLEKYGHASLMTAAGVFFHLEELHSVVEGVKKLLKKDGVFCVQAIYLGGMIENTAFDQIYHEHLCYYTLKSLEALFALHGLEVFSVQVVPIHGGSLEAHVGHKGAHPIDASVLRFRQQELDRGYGEFSTYVHFADNVRRLQRDLIALLRDYAAAGKRVYAYGAPAKGATLLNSFGIDASLVQLAIERSPLKFGMMIPGARIPIVDEAQAERPDAYLLLAWNFIDEILEKERAYLELGGAFIVPVPELRVLTAGDLKKARENG